MLTNTFSPVNYFSTRLAGKEDKCFDLAVSGILFLSYSLIDLGSIWFTCYHPGLTVELGDRMLGVMEPEPMPKAYSLVATPTPRAGIALGQNRS